MWHPAHDTVRARDERGRIDRIAVSADRDRVLLDFGDGRWAAFTPLAVGRLRALLRDKVAETAEATIAAERERE